MFIHLDVMIYCENGTLQKDSHLYVAGKPIHSLAKYMIKDYFTPKAKESRCLIIFTDGYW